MEKSRGMKYNPHGILADIPLRQIFKPSQTTRDPMHVVLANGVMNVEIYLLLEGLRRDMFNFNYKVMEEYVASDWRFPRKATSLTYAFHQGRETASRKAGMFKASASEILRLYPILRNFVLVVASPAALAPDECKSFLALCRVVDCMQTTKWNVTDDNLRDLDANINVYRAEHCRVYGRDWIRPKHHYLFHITKVPRMHTFWMDCFTHERKHQMIKAAVESIDQLSSYETSCLEMVITKTLVQQQHFALSMLEAKVKCNNELSLHFGGPCSVSRSMRFDGVYYTDSSLVMFDGLCGLVKAL